ncbi:MAG TPA: hypothetical protein PK605_10615 [Ignavibacteria bacterium]|nr:hypothetical protein [Bacteroidota bacterium]HRE10835.1 hypothetical protein [Ignavibacteria bacterium]HRF66072.1 hypothetical protein [Ignavibacteria bacterium]HRJ04841.1 hypothetical protein [Ignavibacteria bacterium]HRJ86053.1 hypothetical protein [Ignavibacteria bacterium]
MKKTLLLFIPAFVIMIGIISCGNSGDGGLLGNNTVNFTMGAQQSTNGVQFTWQPSVDVKVTKLVLGTGNFRDSITDNSGQTYAANQQWAYPNEYTGVTSGQQWQFIFTGTTASNNQAYTSTINYTIP